MESAPAVDVPIPLRRVAPPEAPFPGEILPGPGGGTYRVAAADVTPQLWSADTGGHLLAPEDVDRIADQTVVMLPLLSARLCGGESPFDLTRGQAVTLGISVLRGAVDAARSGWGDGQWWSTTEGRPVLVPVGTRGWGPSSQAVLDRIPDAVLDPGIRTRLADAMTDRVTLPFAAPGLEDELFALASAEPFVIGRPLGAPSPPSERNDGGDPLDGGLAVARSAAAGLVDADVMRRVTLAITGAREMLLRAVEPLARWRREQGGGDEASPARRRTVWVALGTVAVTLVVGLSLPAGADGIRPSVPEASHSIGLASPEPSATGAGPTGDESALPPSSDHTPPADPASRLVDDLADCWRAADTACRATILERPDADLPDGIATADAPRAVHLLDDLGGVEVMRVDDPSGQLPSQVVVVVSHHDKRLVRDVYDVADQP
ncbi:hypothetical protein ABC195_12435 [Microbacterium sp. 2P01SA-2]|uniref:hypothetical protein n=1 Tax=unclassified Microbacterium TaxID=2609290 RepID=UPI0039A02720